MADPRARLVLLPILLLTLAAACGGGGGGEAAPVEPPPPRDLALTAAPVDFGLVDVGATVERVVAVRNPNGATPVTVTAVGLPGGGLVGHPANPALPVVLEAGEVLAYAVRWTPSAVGSVPTPIEVVAEDRPRLPVRLIGTAFLEEDVRDLGLVPLDPATRETATLAVEVPADTISLAIEAAAGSRAAPGGGAIVLASFTAPGERVLVDDAAPHAGPYRFDRHVPSIALNGDGRLPFAPRDLAHFALPNTDAADAQPIEGGGTYRFRLAHPGGSAAALQVRVILERRPGARPFGGSVPLNVFLAPGLGITEASAPSDPHLQAMLARAHELLGLAGLGLGDIRYVRLTDPRFDVGDPTDPGPLMEQSVLAPEGPVNVFLVREVLFGAAGLSAGIPGPRVHGTEWSGLYALADPGFHPDDLGTVLAHELCHHLGLGHTREQAGATPWTHDRIDDTCPGAGCVDDPDLNLMVPTALPPGPPQLTPGQVHVLQRSIHVRATSPTFRPPTAPARLASATRRLPPGPLCAHGR